MKKLVMLVLVLSIGAVTIGCSSDSTSSTKPATKPGTPPTPSKM